MPNLRRGSFEDDAAAIRSDWEAVGGDMWTAVRKFARDEWRPGHRHVVAPSGSGYRCVACAGVFEEWPSDSESCPGPAPAAAPDPG